DLGKPILEHQQSTMVAIDPTDQQRQQAEAAERERQLAELKAARESGVLVQGRQASGAADVAPATVASSGQPDAPKLALDPTNDPN
ncbi:conjugal transfer protein TrbI, partial [Acinetobacter baumannii]